MSMHFLDAHHHLSFKYIYLALDADNKGEGGIFARRWKVQGWLGDLSRHHWLLHFAGGWVHYPGHQYFLRR